MNEIIKKNLNEVNLLTLLKILNLMSFIMDKNYEKIDDKKAIVDKIKQIYDDKTFQEKINVILSEGITEEIYKIRINSILNTIDYEEFQEKHDREAYIIYEYKSKSIFFIKNKHKGSLDEEKVRSELKEDLEKNKYEDVIYTFIDNYRNKERAKKIKKINFLKKRTISEILTYKKIVVKNLVHTK